MPKHSVRKLVVAAVSLFLILGFLLVDSSAQKRKRRRRSSAPTITNPAIYQPSPSENSNTSGDNNTGSDSAGSSTNAPARTSSEDPEEMKKTIRTLSNQVDKLSDKLSQMEQTQRSLVDLERLSRAEQRSSQLHSELLDVQGKEGEQQARLQDIEFALKPENIERATAGYGTTHPEEIREQRRKQLEAEKDRVQKQLQHFAEARARLETAVAATDTEVDTLRKKLDAADEAAIQNAQTKARAGGSTAASSPSPTPTP